MFLVLYAVWGGGVKYNFYFIIIITTKMGSGNVYTRTLLHYTYMYMIMQNLLKKCINAQINLPYFNTVCLPQYYSDPMLVL